METYAGLNVLISRMNIEKPDIVFEKKKKFEVLNQIVVEYWTGTVEFEGQRFQRSGPSKKGLRDELCNRMIQVINDMETFTEKKKKTRRGNGKARDQKKNCKMHYMGQRVTISCMLIILFIWTNISLQVA